MSLDVEGAELAVLMNANVSALQLIMIESDGDDPEGGADQALPRGKGFFPTSCSSACKRAAA